MTEATPYEPFDREVRLGDPPWSPEDPKLAAWEAAHGHDVRIKCYVEFGCQVIEPYYERQIEALTMKLDAVNALIKLARAVSPSPYMTMYVSHLEDALGLNPTGVDPHKLGTSDDE